VKKISVFIPVYNCEDYLEECLMSIEQQTFNKKDIEVIIINDGSKDRSLDIINSFSKNNPDWIIKSRENKGVSITRNEGLELVTGEYLMFLDSDDFLEKDALKNVYTELKKSNCDIGIFKTKRFNSKQNLGENYKEFFENGNVITNLSKMPKLVRFIRNASIIYKKEIIKQVRFIPGVVHEDNYFCVKAYSLAKNIYISNTHIYNIRKREGTSLSIMQQLNINSYKDFLYNLLQEDLEIKNLDIIKIHINQLIGYIRKNVIPKDIYEAMILLYDYLYQLKENGIISKFRYYEFCLYSRLKYLIYIYIKVLKFNLKDLYLSFLTTLSPKLNTKVMYKRRLKKEIDLNNPKTFNEKIHWLKLNYLYPNKLITKLVDKVLVRDYLKEKKCEEILTNFIGVYDKVDDIDFDNLPNKFVLKWNFGSGYNIVCQDKNKLNIRVVKKMLKKWGKSKFHLITSELQYKNIERKIICEEFIEVGEGMVPADYKFYCFDGKVEYVMICKNRDRGKPDFYFIDRNWNLTKIRKNYENKNINDLEKPKKLEEMFKYAEVLSADFPFVRVDLYNALGKIYFGELTFTPAAGFSDDYTKEGSEILGDKINLNLLNKKESK